jgi:hypothetical protein
VAGNETAFVASNLGFCCYKGVEMPEKLTRRSAAQLASLAGAALAIGCLGFARAADVKLSKTVAKYRPYSNGIQRCGICLQFQPPNRCKLVAGEISAKGWCQYFAAKENMD